MTDRHKIIPHINTAGRARKTKWHRCKKRIVKRKKWIVTRQERSKENLWYSNVLFLDQSSGYEDECTLNIHQALCLCFSPVNIFYNKKNAFKWDIFFLNDAKISKPMGKSLSQFSRKQCVNGIVALGDNLTVP